MWTKVIVFLAATAVVVYSAEGSFDTRSTKVEGFLKCGTKPLAGAHVRLFRTNTEDLGQVIATGQTDAQGRFSIEGDTGRFKGEEAQIDPHLRVYHKCDLKEGAKDYRKIQLRFPKEFVSLGRVSRRTYNVGALNLEVKYPGESKISKLEGL